MNADKLASFRIDSDLWQQFQSHAKENNVTATALLISYIKSVVNTGNVNTSSEVNVPGLSIQDIDNRIDEKIKQSIQNINTTSLQDIDNRIIESIQDIKPSIQNIEDLIDARIGGSIADGDIGEAIASSYAAVMGQFNGLQDEVRELQNQLQLTPPAVPCSLLPVTNDQLPIPNDQLPMINEQIPELNKSQVQNIRTTLKRKNITASAEQIRKAFMDAGWDGDNWEESRNKAIEILIIPLSEYN